MKFSIGQMEVFRTTVDEFYRLANANQQSEETNAESLTKLQDYQGQANCMIYVLTTTILPKINQIKVDQLRPHREQLVEQLIGFPSFSYLNTVLYMLASKPGQSQVSQVLKYHAMDQMVKDILLLNYKQL